MKIALAIPEIKIGGAEKVVAELANNFVKNGDVVSIITQFPFTKNTYTLDSRIKKLSINVTEPGGNFLRSIKNNVLIFYKLRKVFNHEKPDIIISFLTIMNVRVLLSTLLTSHKVIVSERTNIRMHKSNRWWNYLSFIIYRFAKCIVVQTARIKQMVQTYNNNSFVIPSAIPEVSCYDNSDIELLSIPWEKSIVAVGRLSKEKQLDILIEIFKNINKKRSDWKLLIVGDGRERISLEKKVLDIGLEGAVLFLGYIHNPVRIVRKAQIFTLTSQYEAFPNALLEAMAVGVPCVCFDCVSGPAELIDDGKTGFLIKQNDTKMFEQVLTDLIDDKDKRERIGKAAEYVNDLYSNKNILNMWYTVINHTVNNG